MANNHFNHRKMFTTKPAVQPDNCRGSLIPRSVFAIGSISIQSASRGGMIVRYWVVRIHSYK